MTTDPRLVLERVKTVPREVLEGGELPIRTEDGRRMGALVPITRAVAQEPGVTALLVRWREAHKRFFFTQFTTNEERTALWLERGILGDAGRVLFFMCDESGTRLGHYGLTGVREGHAELDNLIRGERGGDRRLVYYAEVALLAFAFERLGAEVVMLRAFANNVLATAIHDEIGFVRERNEPLVKEETPEGVAWKPAPEGVPPERELVVMSLARESFRQRFAWATPR
jgi:RimJ/RimL family protein N-acetyltransferase